MRILSEGWVNEPEHYCYSSAIDYSGGKGLIDIIFFDDGYASLRLASQEVRRALFLGLWHTGRNSLQRHSLNYFHRTIKSAPCNLPKKKSLFYLFHNMTLKTNNNSQVCVRDSIFLIVDCYGCTPLFALPSANCPS
jgi:hypothetical protein